MVEDNSGGREGWMLGRSASGADCAESSALRNSPKSVTRVYTQSFYVTKYEYTLRVDTARLQWVWCSIRCSKRELEAPPSVVHIRGLLPPYRPSVRIQAHHVCSAQ